MNRRFFLILTFHFIWITFSVHAQESKSKLTKYSDSDISFFYPECYGISKEYRLMVVDTCNKVRLPASVVLSVYTDVNHDTLFQQMELSALNEMAGIGDNNRVFDFERAANDSISRFTFQFEFSKQGVDAKGKVQLTYFKKQGRVVSSSRLCEAVRFDVDMKQTSLVVESIRLFQ